VERVELRTLDETFAIARLAADAPVPSWVGGSDLIAVVRTRRELSIVCRDDTVPQTHTEVQRNFRGLAVSGTLDFSLTGIIADLAKRSPRRAFPFTASRPTIPTTS